MVNFAIYSGNDDDNKQENEQQNGDIKEDEEYDYDIEQDEEEEQHEVIEEKQGIWYIHSTQIFIEYSIAFPLFFRILFVKKPPQKRLMKKIQTNMHLVIDITIGNISDITKMKIGNTTQDIDIVIGIFDENIKT